ncbi:chitinase-like protein Idgf4 isoform X1 [Episyrphus balteatus]|uniref:chitinase-like protein Idgf4 isoform X1 n=1 Tax=Episyrphus balteatus TaxID=286459 RepID=UPI002486C295|nr:chitinase-like protein Idgf4 isoform X1 [Episyrphus balteatus]
MKFFILFTTLLVGVLGANISNISIANNPAARLICYYDSSSFSREGLGKLTTTDLEPALQFCSHMVYGYAGLHNDNSKLISLNQNLDLDAGKGHFRTITNFKKKYPHLKILLGVGGGRDENPEKYLSMLEASVNRMAFINSAHALVKTYNFDGIDLGWQFPPNKPKKIRGSIGKFWKGFKKIFSGDSVLDEKAEEHKEEFTALVRELKNAFRPEGFSVSLTVLPNVNSSIFIDVNAIVNYLDFVTLAAFDFQTPTRNPKEADFPAPLYELNERNPEHNVNYQVQYWLNGHCPATKINVGIAAYGRAWKMSSDSGITGVPPIPETEGEAPAGLSSLTPGFLSWPEVCSKLPNPSNSHLKGADAPLRRVGDPTKRFGTYAYRIPDDNGEHGMWVGYEDADTAGNKASYVRAKGLGGIALFDLSHDDFGGRCTGDRYPLLRAAKARL